MNKPKIGSKWQRRNYEYPVEVIEYPPNFFSHYNKTAETELIIIQFYGGQYGIVCMALDEFLELYKPYKKGE